MAFNAVPIAVCRRTCRIAHIGYICHFGSDYWKFVTGGDCSENLEDGRDQCLQSLAKYSNRFVCESKQLIFDTNNADMSLITKLGKNGMKLISRLSLIFFSKSIWPLLSRQWRSKPGGEIARVESHLLG